MKLSRRFELSLLGPLVLSLWGMNAGALEVGSAAPEASPAAQSVAPPQTPAPQYSPGLAEIMNMVEAKVDPGVIKAYIKNSEVAYNPSAAEIIALTQKGVPNDVLTSILQRGGEVRAQMAQAAQSAPKASAAPAYAATPPPAYTPPTVVNSGAYSAPTYVDYPYTYPYYGYPYSYSYWYNYGYPWGWYWPFYVNLGWYGGYYNCYNGHHGYNCGHNGMYASRYPYGGGHYPSGGYPGGRGGGTWAGSVNRSQPYMPAGNYSARSAPAAPRAMSTSFRSSVGVGSRPPSSFSGGMGGFRGSPGGFARSSSGGSAGRSMGRSR